MDMDYERQLRLTSTPIKSTSSTSHSASRYDTPGTSYRQQRPQQNQPTNRLGGSGHNNSSNQYHKNCARSTTTSSATSATNKLPQHNGSKNNNSNNNHITFDTSSLASTNPKEAIARLRAELEELKRDKSELALENEILKSDLNQAIHDVDQLRIENEQLNQIVLEKEAVHTKLKSQLKTVTETAYTFYEKFVAFKCRYYKEVGLTGNHHDWLEHGDDH